ncbi:MAG: chlorite dismutase [Proteobacteria bacterium SG_bin9]|nr:MAG: chlorite dismutase [Proteobacteria bacterium SG_bin9]
MFTVFSAGDIGAWRMTRCEAARGDGLPAAARLAITPSDRLAPSSQQPPSHQLWQLAGFASNVRYVERAEKTALVNVQAGLGRTEATCAALIPIKKSAAWWDLTQEERRDIFEAQSHHIAGSMTYLPAIARQLYHARDLGQPFDFLTWFEYAPEHADDFEQLVAHLRQTPEWAFVEREVDIRLTRA